MISYKPSQVENFNLEDYNSYINNFSSDKVLGSTYDAKDAKKKAELVWIELYGDNVKKEKPYKVFYDTNNNAWLVMGSFHKGLLNNKTGGIAYIIILKETGKVVAVWHDK